MRVNEIIPGPDGYPNEQGPTFKQPIRPYNRFGEFSTVEWVILKVALRDYLNSYGTVPGPPTGWDLFEELEQA